MKTTYNGTYTQVDELESSEGLVILKQRLKDVVLKDSLVRANFLAGAHFLKTLKDPSLLAINQVIETKDEVGIVCKNEGFQQLGVFLEDSGQLKDSYLVELITKMLKCLDSLHNNSIFHQGLNPNSFVVDAKGNVKLTLFGTLEHRLYHHLPAIGNENPSIQNAIRFYSPERKENYGIVNQSSEYYSFGMIIWYLLCVQRNLSSHEDLVLNFPDYTFTGSIWDKVLEACLNEDRKKRPKSSKEILGLLPIIDAKSSVSNPIKEKTPKKVNIIFFNYNSFHHEIKVNGNSLENYKYQITGRKLTIEVEEGIEFKVFMKKDGTFLTSFNSSQRWQYTLPGNFDEVKPNQNKPNQSLSNSVLYFVIAILLLVVLILLFRQCGNNYNSTINASDDAKGNDLTSENATNKGVSKIDSLKKIDPVRTDPELPFPYSKSEIVDLISNYYSMINRGDAINFETYFEPVIDQFFRVSNMSRIAAKKNYEEIMLKNFSSNITYNLNDITVSTVSESAFVSVPAKIMITKYSDNTVKNFDIIHYFKISKNLKIKSLTEKILNRY
jgi:serine/threonine protein kinase